MNDFLAWFALVLWLAALGLRLHPRTRSWAPRGIADRAAGPASGRAPAPRQATAGIADLGAALPPSDAVPRDTAVDEALDRTLATDPLPHLFPSRPDLREVTR